MKKKYHIICTLISDEGRDVEIILPIVYFAEKYLDCTVEFIFFWEAHKIFRKKPDLVIIPANTVGDHLLFEIAKHAAECGIKVFSFISEGNFRTNGSFDYWGYNYEKKFYQDYVMHWSKRTQNFLINELPHYKDKMVLTGAPGFDRYKIYEFLDKETFLRKNGLTQYKKIITYAGWAFGKLANQQGIEELMVYFLDNTNALEWAKEQMFAVEEVLKKAIENNKDTLFILKKHPSEVNPSIEHLDYLNEMVRLKDYPNVIYTTNDIAIHDLINISDLWLGFETTTALETWIMVDKPTILINPDDAYFEQYRDELYKGSIIVKDYPSLQKCIDKFYEKGKLDEFYTEDKIQNRKKIITDTIGYEDGLNHLRSGYYLMKTLEQIESEKNKSIFSFNFFIKYFLLHIGKYFYIKSLFLKLPKFKKTIFIFERYKMKNIPILQKKYYLFLDKFYRDKQLPEKIESGNIWNEIIE